MNKRLDIRTYVLEGVSSLNFTIIHKSESSDPPTPNIYPKGNSPTP